jgi:hypothetical protein
LHDGLLDFRVNFVLENGEAGGLEGREVLMLDMIAVEVHKELEETGREAGRDGGRGLIRG